MFEIANRLKNVEISASAAITDMVRDLRREGSNVLSLSSGEPDFPTPRHAIEAAYAAALAGDTKYPNLDGTHALKQAIQRKFKRENGLDYALNEILVANGGKQVIYNAILASCNPGDEVIVPAPGWISYADIVTLAEAKPVPVPCHAENGFLMSAADLEAAITPKTRWLLLNFPNNPTGAVATKENLQAIADVLLRHPGVLVMSDDIYEHLRYDDVQFWTMAQVEPRMKERTLTVNGVSKSYAMTGWRVGYCGGNSDLIAAMKNMQAQICGGICTLSQAAAVAVLDGPQDVLIEQAEIYRLRRNEVHALLNDAPGVTCHLPDGAFYLYANIAACIGKTTAGGQLIQSDTDFVKALLAEQHVATVQGSAYGMSPYFRISYATDMDTLRAACLAIRRFCEQLR